jgi:hypothetical protein
VIGTVMFLLALTLVAVGQLLRMRKMRRAKR